MFKKIKILTLVIITIILISSPILIVRAQTASEDNMILSPLTKEGTGVAGQAGYATVDENSPRKIVANIVRVVLGFTGIIFLILIIASGYQWMTSEGNEEKIASAKKRLINSAIGVLIILCAYVIANTVVTIVQKGLEDENTATWQL